jgi:HSP20 family protein
MRYLVKRNNDLFDNLFDDFFDFPFSSKRALMRTDIQEDADHYQIDIELPGFNKDEIKINLQDGYLKITAQKEQNNQEQEKRIIRQERFYGELSRRFYVGNLSETDINAKYNNGILTVLLPKQSKAENKKYINIE